MDLERGRGVEFKYRSARRLRITCSEVAWRRLVGRDGRWSDNDRR